MISETESDISFNSEENISDYVPDDNSLSSSISSKVSSNIEHLSKDEYQELKKTMNTIKILQEEILQSLNGKQEKRCECYKQLFMLVLVVLLLAICYMYFI